MAKKKEEQILEKIFDYTLEDIMGERFASYSKYIIQDRAIPDARDGLKPVQRRILYSMHKERNTYDKGYRKSAKTVGDVIGNYHPHGDTSIYDAMVRMSQPWKTRLPYIDMHGNNGSIDGDSPAAYRYTEARLSKISGEMLRDIDKDTVEFAPNFDDTIQEPTVLPARFPALFVYGAQGISAGYATNIPPHNLNEIVDAAIYRIDNPESSLDELMEIVKGPDFPTGGIVEGLDGIKQAYTTGKGKVVIKSRYKIEEDKDGVHIVITEIPFEANKSVIVKKIDDIRLDKKVDGIVEVRDESTKDVRIVIDIKKNANKDLIIAYIFKNTDLQINYNFNTVAIVNKRPKLLGLREALDAFIKHQEEVVTRRTEFDLKHAKSRFHIVEGLIKCISILDEVIKVIRASKNKEDAKNNLVKEFDFTIIQADAIVTLQLYRLTNTDVVALEEELKNLTKIIEGLTAILENKKILRKVMKKDLSEINSLYVTPRLTDIKEEVTELKIDKIDMVPKEDVIVILTKDGYIKRTSIRSYESSKEEDLTIKDNDYLLVKEYMNTLDTLLVFTSYGNYLHIPVHEIPDLKWKDMPKHISNLITIQQGEGIVSGINAKNFDSNLTVLLATSNGMVKQTNLSEFKLLRYSKPTLCMKLKDDDSLIDAYILTKDKIFMTTDSGFGVSYMANEIPVVGIKASGVIGMKLKNDNVVSVNNYSDTDEYISFITNKGTGKRVRLKDFDLMSRARRGVQVIRDVKTNPYNIIKSFVIKTKDSIGIKNESINIFKNGELPITDRQSVGTALTKHELDDAFILKSLKEIEDEVIVPKKELVSLDDIDSKLMTIDDFLK